MTDRGLRDDVHQCPESAVGRSAAAAIPASPLITVIVRSMDRPELAQAVASIARQDHPAIETIVVDATGGRHRPLPPMQLPAGHELRVVGAGHRLPRPQAAALGLASANGEWFTFLDDDDTWEPSHLSALVAAARAFPSALVVYGRGRVLRPDGSIERLFGRPFNRALMHWAPLFYWQTALVRTRVRELGCAFDPELEVCEDRDFIAQVAEHGDLVFVPELATFNFRPDVGTSGTGSGANRDQARIARFDNLLRAKWAGHGAYHNERAAVLSRQGVRAFFAGDFDGSERAFVAALALYPDDPNARHGLARVALARGDRALAERHARAAIEVNPAAAEYRQTLAAIRGPVERSAGGGAQAVARTAPCPCGSGIRYKECCGRIVAKAVDDSRATHARHCAAARLALDRGDAPSAWEHLKAAAEIRCDAPVGFMLEACCARLCEHQSVASLWAMAWRLRSTASAASAPPSPRRVTIVGAPSLGDGAARQIALLGSVLGEHAEVDIVPELRCDSPLERPGGCVVFVEPDAIPAEGVPSIVAQRIVIRVPRADPAALVRAYARLAGCGTCPVACEFTLPHAGVASPHADRSPIEYPWVDPSLFQMDPPVAGPERALVVGRHGPPEPGEDHPDDAALYLRLGQAGHRIAVPATELLRRTSAPALRDGASSAVVLATPGPTLDEIDVFLYRGDPNDSGRADLRLLEAMAAARVPIVFPASIGAREWIADGENAFIAVSEEDALRRVAQLSRDRELLQRVGRAARRTAAAAMHAQRRRALAFYLNVSLNE